MLSSVSLLDAYIKNGAELSAKRSDAAETFMSNGLGGVKLIPRACVCAAFILSVVRAGAFILFYGPRCVRAVVGAFLETLS